MRLKEILANADVIDGVRFVGASDSRMCDECASYDGTVWFPSAYHQIAEPPRHPGCRCTLVPYFSSEGDTVTQIAASADFWGLAENAYNEKMARKGSLRRWKDLAESTQTKYYYQAQKSYERHTGLPAYRPVTIRLRFIGSRRRNTADVPPEMPMSLHAMQRRTESEQKGGCCLIVVSVVVLTTVLVILVSSIASCGK